MFSAEIGHLQITRIFSCYWTFYSI